MEETIAGGLSSNEPIIFDLADFVERVNKFLYKDDFVTAESLTEDINRVATETGLTTEQIQSVMISTLTIMEERREAAGVDSSKIGSGYAYGAYIVKRPRIFPRWGQR